MPLYSRILFFFLCAASSVPAYAQVVAGFSASPLSGCAPLVVFFNNTTVPLSGTTYSWDLGNGSGVITLTNPATSYPTAGTYTVTLTATNGGHSSVHTEIVNVYPQPTVSFTVGDTAPCLGAPVTFASTSTAGMSGGLSYVWSFGDGYTATTSPAVHAYGLPGRFNISLTATNAAGCSNTLTQSSLVHVYSPPVPLFSSGTRRICKHSGNVSFISSSTGSAPFTYRWDFGDGGPPSTAANPTHFYAAPGHYSVKLTVTDAHGCTDSLMQPTYISVTALTAAFTNLAACRNSPVTFVNTSSSYLSAQWFYGDGNSGSTINGSNIYPNYGTDTVMLVAADSFCTDTAIHYLNFPVPSFHTVPDTPCPAPVTVTVNAIVPAGSSISWDLGDGGSAGITGSPITHLYTTSGSYLQKMYVTTPAGCRDTVSNQYNIQTFGIQLLQQPIPKGGCAPFRDSIGQDPNASSPYFLPFKYAINFGDGTPIDTLPHVGNTSTIPVRAHIFVAPGLYPVKVTLISTNGCVGIAYDTVPVGIPKQATFTATPRDLCYNRNLVTFTRTLVSDTADQYVWLFGEGTQGASYFDTARGRVVDIIHHFSIPDTAFSDTLITYYRGCPDTFVQHNYIRINGPAARGYRTVICSPPRSVMFKSISLGADSVKWYFGDGSTSTVDSVMHTYSVDGLYSPMLTAYNVRSGCRDTLMLVPVDFRKPTVAITVSDTTICKGNIVLFSAATVSGHASAYQWLIGGHSPGNITSDFQPFFVDTFNTPGRYTLRLVVFDQNTCTDTITKSNYILVAQPAPRIAVSPSVLCAPQVTTLTDSSTDQPGVSITNHVWLFGDGGGTATTGPSVVHTYTATGSYRITEYVTDNLGCLDSITLTRSLYGAKSSFTAPTHPCGRTGIVLINASPPASYLWLFGDGATSTATTPVHAFPDTGSYNVQLVAIDPHGCRDTSMRTVTVTRPHASFTMSDSIGVCPPLQVVFTNSSTRGKTYFWNLGNGTSIATNPIATYTPGFDIVYLVAIDSFGCRDTSAGRHVKVYGYAGAFSYNVDSGCVPLRVFFDAGIPDTSMVSSIIWDFGRGVVSPPLLSDTITHYYSTADWYVPTLIISNHSGCTSSSTGRDTIKADRVIAGFTASPDPVCIHSSMHFADTSKSYWSHMNRWRWTINGAVTATDTTSAVFTVPGAYSVVLHATDAWGCFADDTQSVYAYALPVIVAAPDAMICTGQTISLTDSATGGLWSSGSGAAAVVGSVSGVVAGIAAGMANITYAVGGTCYATIVVTVNAYPDSGIISGDSVLCVGVSKQLSENISGGVWSIANANAAISSSGMVTGLIVGVDTATYTVTSAGCTSAASKPIVVVPSPDPGSISGHDTLCKNAMIILSETSSNGHWNSADTSVASIDSGGRVLGLGVGSTVISFTINPDSNDCSSVAAFPVVVINTDLSVTPVVTGVKCFNESNGSITLTLDSGTPPFRFAWSTGDSTSSIDSLPAGAYSVTILEPARNCTLQQSFTISSPDSLYVTAEVINDVCSRPNGSIKLLSKGGVAPYHFVWSNKSLSAEIIDIPSGTYSCTITDLNGCEAHYATVVIDSTCTDIIIHEGISPNGDGINDTWVIEGLWRYPDNVVKIFDKLGDEIFEETHYMNDWNGSGGKGTVPDGTYYYMVKLNSQYPPHGKDIYTGAILIKR